jgi:hypothetical protein
VFLRGEIWRVIQADKSMHISRQERKTPREKSGISISTMSVFSSKLFLPTLRENIKDNS